MVPAGAVALIFTGLEGVGLYVATTVINLAISAVLGKVLAPDIDQSGRDTKGLQQTIKSNIAPRVICYGEAIVGGPYVMLETWGQENHILGMIIALTSHPVEDILGVFIDDEYVNIAGNTDGSVNSDTNDLTGDYWVKNGKYGTGDAKRHVKIIKNLGWGYADNTYVKNKDVTWAVNDRERAQLIKEECATPWQPPAINATRDSTTGLYSGGVTRLHKLTNCSHIFLKFVYNPDVWSGYPNVRFHIKGKRLYNPGKDNTNFAAEGAWTNTQNITDPDTYTYSENWGVACLDYLINRDYGIGANTFTPFSEIDWEAAIEAIVDSDVAVTNGLPAPDNAQEKRYTVNGVFEVSSTPISIMDILLTSGAGQLIYAQGKYKLRAGVYKAPDSVNDIINEDMIISPLTIRTHTPRSELFNKAGGVFVNAGSGYNRSYPGSMSNKPEFEPSDFPLVNPLNEQGVNPYEEFDGRPIVKDFDYPFTISSFTAQRLARIQLERVRSGLTVSFEANLKILKFSVGDTVYLEILNDSKYMFDAFYNRLGFDDEVQDSYYKQFKIIDMFYNENFNISVTLIEEAPELYDWNDGDANEIDYALISELVFDDPTGEIIKPTFYISAFTNPIDEVLSWPNVSLYVRWTAPSRGSSLNGLDRALIRSYILEYGVVDNPSALEPQDGVTNWINAGAFIVTDPSLDVQGPISLENLYIDDNTKFNFRVRAVLFNGRRSNWAYYNEDFGSFYTPQAPPSASIGQPLAGQLSVIYNVQNSSPLSGGGNTVLQDGEFALLSHNPTTYIPQDYREIDTIILCAADKDGNLNDEFYSMVRGADVITLFINKFRWYKFLIAENRNIAIVRNNANLYYPEAPADYYAYAFDSLELIDYNDPEPTNIGTGGNQLLSQDIELRFERDPTVSSLTKYLDLEFNRSRSVQYGEFSHWLLSFYSNTTDDVNSGTSWDLLPGTGENGGNAIYMSVAGGNSIVQSIWLENVHMFKNIPGSWKLTLRYQSINGGYGSSTSSYLWLRLDGHAAPYPSRSGGTYTYYKQLNFPATGSGNWRDLSFIITPTDMNYVEYLILGLNASPTETDILDILIDSIKFEPYFENAGYSVVNNSNVYTCNTAVTDNFDIDLSTATDNVTIDIVSSLPSQASKQITISTTQGSTARTITFNNNGTTSGLYWPNPGQPTATSGFGSQDLYTFYTLWGGQIWVGSALMDVS